MLKVYVPNIGRQYKRECAVPCAVLYAVEVEFITTLKLITSKAVQLASQGLGIGWQSIGPKRETTA